MYLLVCNQRPEKDLAPAGMRKSLPLRHLVVTETGQTAARRFYACCPSPTLTVLQI